MVGNVTDLHPVCPHVISMLNVYTLDCDLLIMTLTYELLLEDVKRHHVPSTLCIVIM